MTPCIPSLKIGLFSLLFLLFLLVSSNVFLTAWILQNLFLNDEFTAHHGLPISRELSVNGTLWALGALFASKVASFKTLQVSAKNVLELKVGDSFLRIQKHGVVIQSPALTLYHDKNSVSPSLSLKQNSLLSRMSHWNLSGSATSYGSLQVENIQSFNNLRLESRTNALHLFGPHGISLEAPGGSIQLKGSEDIILQGKQIHLNVSRVFFPQLLSRFKYNNNNDSSSSSSKSHQLCICNNGKLYGAPSIEQCSFHNGICD